MKLKTVFILNAIIAFIYALGLFLMPGTMFSLHGMDQNASATLMAQFFATELLGMGLVAFLVRDSEKNNARNAVVLGFFLHDIVGAIVALLATLSGAMNAMGWLAFAVYALLTLGYGYFQFVSTDS